MPFVVSTNHQLDVQRSALITTLEESAEYEKYLQPVLEYRQKYGVIR